MTTRTIAWAVLMLSTAMVVGAVWAQAEQDVMVGMPQYGVTLSGTPDDPVLENHSGKVIIGYGMAGGGGQILAHSALPAGLANGRSMYTEGSYPTDANPQRNRVKNVGAPALTSAALTCLIFADGHFVGADEHGVFEDFSKELKAVREVGNLAKAGAWDQLDALAQAFSQAGPNPPPGGDRVAYAYRLLAAQRLVETRRLKGDAAAAQLAQIYSSLPTPRKH